MLKKRTIHRLLVAMLRGASDVAVIDPGPLRGVVRYRWRYEPSDPMKSLEFSDGIVQDWVRVGEDWNKVSTHIDSAARCIAMEVEKDSGPRISIRKMNPNQQYEESRKPCVVV